MNPNTTEPCYVVLRVDVYRDAMGPATLTTVKLVCWTQEEADAQVARLNTLNEPKGCKYHWEMSRALRRASV